MNERVRNIVEKVVTVTDDEPDPKKRLVPAAEAALTGFAPDGGSWLEARDAFEEAIDNGNSVNTALDRATNPIATELEPEDSVRVTNEAKVRFWDAMGPHEEGEEPTAAIERALNGFAPDGGSWLEARDAFYSTVEAGVTDVDLALSHALATVTEKTPGTETHPEVARDRFYAGIDPNYAAKDHYAGRERGIQIGGFEVGVGRDVQAKRRRQLGKLAAQHGQDQK